MKTFRVLSSVMVLCLALTETGCAGPGLNRTSLTPRKEKEFKKLGISLTIPSKSMFVEVLSTKKFDEKGRGRKSLSFYLHPVYSKHLLAEPIYLIDFSLYRLTAGNYKLFQKENHNLSFRWRFKEHYKEFYSDVTEYICKYRNADAYCYRKDYKCPNGDIILVAVVYCPLVDNKEHEKEDIEAIKKMLNSVKFLDEKKSDAK